MTYASTTAYAEYVRRLFTYCLYTITFVIVASSFHTAQAATQTHTCVVARSRLDWRVDSSTGSDTTKHCVLPQFDTSLGVLTKADLSVSADTDTQQKVENKDVSPHTMTTDVTVKLDVQRNDGTGLLSVSIPTSDETFPASAFDGTLDYAGTSGKTFDVQTGEATKTHTFTAESDLAMFMGTGSYDFPLLAEALWNCSGSGNAACEVDTYAAAAMTITYSYTPPAPDIVFNSCNMPEVRNGETKEYIITSANQGNAPITETITITDQLPECLSFVSSENGQWSCTADANQLVTCEFKGTVPAGAFLPDLPITVSADGCIASSVLSHTIRVSTEGEIHTANNSLACSGVLAQSVHPTAEPTPQVSPTQEPAPSPTPTPAVLGDSEGPRVLAATGLKIILPIVIGGLLILGVILLRRRKAPAKVLDN